MTKIRLATFNCENLMMRCDFRAPGIDGLRDKLTAVTDLEHARAVGDVFDVLSEDDRTLTAQALAATRADICALQEVENLVTLNAFHDRYLRRWSTRPYGEQVLVEGNDTRGIDVACLSRLPVRSVTSHARARFLDLGLSPRGMPAEALAFRRDCLALEIDVRGRILTLFVCHLKSMHGGRAETRAVREAEARAIRAIITDRFTDPAAAIWAVVGDFNDYRELDGEPLSDHGLGPLLSDGFAIDLAEHAIADPFERWTHHYSGDDTYGALDHILVSPALFRANAQASVQAIRGGLPRRATRHRGFRFPGIGWSVPKASDHCPLVAELTIPDL